MQEYFIQIISTVIILILIPVSKIISGKIIRRYSRLSKRLLENRTRHVIKVVYILVNVIGILLIVIVWGVNPRNIVVAISSIFAVIGIAFFAQWSLLSNITAGILIFFTTPIRIGDIVTIHDKELPIEAEVIDILTFHIHFKTKEGEIVVYPNSLLFQKGLSIINKDNNSKKENEYY